MTDPFRPRRDPLAAGDVIRRAAEESRQLLGEEPDVRAPDMKRLVGQIKRREGALEK